MQQISMKCFRMRVYAVQLSIPKLSQAYLWQYFCFILCLIYSLTSTRRANTSVQECAREWMRTHERILFKHVSVTRFRSCQMTGGRYDGNRIQRFC